MARGSLPRQRPGRDAGADQQDLRFLAKEQAALRRVATLVAQGAHPDAVFDAVCEETGRLIDATNVNLARFAPGAINETMAGWSLHGNHVPKGTRLPLDGETINVAVRRTGAPARVDSYEGVAGALAALLRRLGIRSEVAAPVLVGGRVWGALIAGSDREERFPPGSEDRVASFAELIATAVSNAMARSELVASRARIVTAADAARRRVTRDLHDGAQQGFVSSVIKLQLAHGALPADPERARDLLAAALADAETGLDELRGLAAGIHPPLLATRGLQAALEALADRAALVTELRCELPGRLSEEVEAGAYFFVAEALTNVIKHAGASHATVTVRATPPSC